LRTRVSLDIRQREEASGILIPGMMPLGRHDQSILHGLEPRLSHILSGCAQRGYLDLIEIFAPPGSIARRDIFDQPHAIPNALRGGHIGCAQALLDAGCPLNTGNGDDVSLCIEAALARHESLQFLLDLGIDPNHADSSGNTPLHLCCARERPDTLRFLLARGADTERRNLNGETPAMLAALMEHMQCLAALVEAGCSIDARHFAPEAFGATAAILCAENDCLKPLDFLLRAGASLDPAERWELAMSRVEEAYDSESAAKVAACIEKHALARSTPPSRPSENDRPALRI
jgi:ankyrin repeat protein